MSDSGGWPDPAPGVFSNLPTSPPVPWWSIGLCSVWFLPVLIYWLFDYLTRQRRRTVQDAGASGTGAPSAEPAVSAAREVQPVFHSAAAEQSNGEDVVPPDLLVMLASLEHSLPHRRQARAIAGGLGKVVDLVSRHHPTNIIMVHPMLSQEEGQVSYGEPDAELAPVRLLVDGRREEVRVFRHRVPLQGPGNLHADFLLLSHPLFEARTKQGIYPNPMTRRVVLRFFSLWNQAVGALLARHKPDIFHCPDFHCALAPWYALPRHPTLRVLLVLHNAEYQGQVNTDMIRAEKLDTMAQILNLPAAMVQRHMIVDGRFNMLKAAVDFVWERQRGQGICAVSHWYAQEVRSAYSLFWKLKRIEGLDNPMLEEERPKLGNGLLEAKTKAKQEIQRHFGLTEDPNARLFVSLGRLVRQKGVDVLADIAPWLLSNFPDAQLILIGPVGDGFGHYAAAKLRAMAEAPEFQGRLFVRCEFVKVPESLKLAADFCLMPSRDEPFGYVDVEFAWCGAVLVGAQAGGLGKVPGFYYVAQNRENLGRLRRELRTAVARAMRAPQEQLRDMAFAALRCEFPLDAWQRRLLSLYKGLLPKVESAPAEVWLSPASRDNEISMAGMEEGARESVATFLPYTSEPSEVAVLGPVPNEREITAQDLSRPVSMINALVEAGPAEAGVRNGSHLGLGSFDLGGEREFLTQELDEDELASRVSAKVKQFPQMGIDEVLESVGADVDLEREENPWGKFLLQPTLGVLRIHWIIAIGYVVSPIAEFLAFVTATEWGTRGAEPLPAWTTRIIPALSVFVGGAIDPPALAMILFSFNALSFAIAAPLWALLCRFVQPRKLMAWGILLQLPILLTIIPVAPRFMLAVIVVFLHGLVTACSTLFLVFNFMMSIKADMSHYAVRMGVLELLRNLVTWLLTGYVFVASPSAQAGTKDNPEPSIIMALLAPLAGVLLLLTLAPGILCLYAPGPYREDRFPGWDLGLFFKKKSYILLAFSECIGSLAIFPSTCYISWWLANGWNSESLASLSVLFAVLLAVGTGLWAWALSFTSKHGYSVLIGTTLLLAPPGLLRAVAQEEVATFASLGKSQAAVIIVVISLLLDGVRSSAIWTAKIRILNSRWRLLSYATIEQTCIHICAFLSPGVCELIARTAGASFITRNQKELADAVIACVVPLCSAQFAIQVLAAPFIYKDMGVSVAVDRETHAAAAWRRLVKRGTLTCAVLFGAALAGLFVVIEINLLDRVMPIDPTHRCYVTAQPNCTTLKDEVDVRPAAEGWHYGPNQYGQNTTGRHNCRLAMREAGGDTFIFWGYGRCLVQKCGGLSEISPQPETPQPPASSPWGEAEVWSHHCSHSGQNIVAVHLFEWTWQDVARECEENLGPGGITAVQVSPPAEHVLGDGWATRYQPVSYKLESRSGSRDEFIDMVQRCRQVGVNIMVDAVLNHMASPYLLAPKKDAGKECGAPIETNATTTRKCWGWAYTEYGNREFPDGTQGLDRFDRQHFHHYPDNLKSNCGLPPWTNNKRLCDMFSLPDLDTEAVEVQSMLTRYLFVLFEIGVTYLRCDAAMNIYPESLARILDPIPWDYVVQEYYPDAIADTRTNGQAIAVGSITDFNFGTRVAQSLFDAWDGHQWINRSKAFGELLDLSSKPLPNCPYKVCDTPYKEDHALIFLDNHDSQRERWKDQKADYDPICFWDGNDIGNCRPIYKHGREYLLVLGFMLTWPYGDGARIMSSYGWKLFEQGPPGVRPDSLHDMPSSVRCRDAPTTSPVTLEYDDDTHRPWVCEHRWQGILAMARFRRLVGKQSITFKWKDNDGRIAFGLGNVGFVALSRGWNYHSRMGSNASLDFAEVRPRMVTKMPGGVYCNLANVIGPLKGPKEWTRRCFGEPVTIAANGTIVKGQLLSANMVVLHLNYTVDRTWSVDGWHPEQEAVVV